MLEETSLSDPHEEAFAADPRGGEDVAVDPRGGPVSSSPSPSGARDRGRVIAIGTMGALMAVGIGLIVASPRRGGGGPNPAAALTSGDLAARDTNADGGKEA